MTELDENFTSERAEKEEQFGKVPLWLYELKPSSNAIRLYGYLDCKFGNSKRGIFPGQDTLAEANDLSKKSVQRALQELQELRALQVTRRGQGKTNLYRLMWTNPAKPVVPTLKRTSKAAPKKQANQPRSTSRACATPTKEVTAVSQAELERQQAKRAEDERRRAQEEADRKARQAERAQWRLEGALEGIQL